jgi:hypothetical protein
MGIFKVKLKVWFKILLEIIIQQKLFNMKY